MKRRDFFKEDIGRRFYKVLGLFLVSAFFYVSYASDLPDKGDDATTKIKLRAPKNKRIKKVKVSGKNWNEFSPEQEVVILPPKFKGEIVLEVIYQPTSNRN